MIQNENWVEALVFHYVLKIKREGGKNRLFAFYNKHISKVN